MLVSSAQRLKAKLQLKGKYRPHKAVLKKMPDGSGALGVLPTRGKGVAADAEYCAAESCSVSLPCEPEALLEQTF